MVTPHELHNKLAGEIVASIVKPPLETGGTPVDVLILLETVILGVYAVCVQLGGDIPVWEVMSERIMDRLVEKRLLETPSQGQG